MGHTTLQLLLRQSYGGVRATDQEAVAELDRRGWRKPMRVLFLVVLLPFILPERLIVQWDGGDYAEQADWPTILGSIIFSAWMVSPVVFVISTLFALAKHFDGNTPNWWPSIVSGAIFVAAWVHYLSIRWLQRGSK
jgi:hypothetical protein